jgi:hypothetical protein
MDRHLGDPGPSTGSLPCDQAKGHKKRLRRKQKIAPVIVDSHTVGPKAGDMSSWDGEMSFGTYRLPLSKVYYHSHEGLAINGRLSPLFTYPVEVLANCRRFRRERGVILGGGKAIHFCVPPRRHPGLSIQEFYAQYAENLIRFHSKRQAEDPKAQEVRRYSRNLEVLRFMRATWDALMIGYQTERLFCLADYGYYYCNSVKLTGIERFRNQLISHPLEAARRLKASAQACRKWYFGGPRPTGRLFMVAEKRVALHVSYVARGLPPAPDDPAGLVKLVDRLTSEPPPEPPDWRPFVNAYIDRFWKPTPIELFTMPSPSAAFGFPRSLGGHNAGVQYLVLLGYALTKIHDTVDPLSISPYGDVARDDGSYLEYMSHTLYPRKGKKKTGIEGLFKDTWEELESTLPDVTMFLQSYLRKGVMYVMDNIHYVPILPISAEEKGLKTRYPTCSLTAVNLVQQVLRRALDSVMIRDPRCAVALGAESGIDLSGEPGPYWAQDATAATDFHPQYLTQAPYEELAKREPRLAIYTKYFNKLFGPKKIVLGKSQSDLAPHKMLQKYPNAPLLFNLKEDKSFRDEFGHASYILDMWNEWLAEINSLPGVITRTGQMMGDPTSFPPLMLVSIYGGEKALKSYPYTRKELKRKHPGLKKKEFVAELVGDDANIPRWTKERRDAYNTAIESLGTTLSYEKCFYHKSRGLIAEVPTDYGRKLPHYPLSILVAPPGGSKGSVYWNNQPTALIGNPRIPQYVFGRYFLKKSPYYEMWKLAYKMGIPVSAPEGYGGINLQGKLFPKVSTTHQAAWLRYLSTLPMEKLISGTSLSIGRSPSTLMASAMEDWLRSVVSTHEELRSIGGLLTTNPLDDSGAIRVELGNAYRAALSTVRSAEFYFRSPPEIVEQSAPSVQLAAKRFQRKVSLQPWFDKPEGWKYRDTVRDLERKTALFFSRPGGFLPYANDKPRTFYGLEQTGVVKRRFKAPHIVGIG